MDSARPRHNGRYLPDPHGDGAVHHLCGCLYRLYRQKPQRPVSQRRSRPPHSGERLPALQQRHYRLCRNALKRHRLGLFKLWWLATILLGLEFLVSTGLEWRKLIYEDHLTVSTNLFGTTFYSLVGLHASHVIVGMTFLILVMLVTLMGFPIETQERRVKFLSWYWHFVDAVWVVVFTVVYVIGR